MEALQLDFFDLFDWLDQTLKVDPISWTEDEVRMLHEWILVRSLETLAAASRPDVIQEIVTWVNGPPDDPFSFRTCCIVSHYDWEHLRDGINYINR